jgi:hypothetical protein
MRLAVPLALCMMLALAGSASGQTPCALSYEVFEFAVPHLDLETCPADLARASAFCRASVGQDAVHVFVFSDEGDRCLVATKSYRGGEFRLEVK